MARMNMGTQLVIALAFVAAALLHGTAADDIVVGGSAGWSVPSSQDNAFYSSWASNKTFKVNDTLVFNFTTGQHTVAQVRKDGYDACNNASTIEFKRIGPANFTLNSTGQHYYICTILGHCVGGQKLSINVVAESNPSPAPSGTGSNSPPTTAPPPPNSASYHGYGVTSSVILLFIAAAMFC